MPSLWLRRRTLFLATVLAPGLLFSSPHFNTAMAQQPASAGPANDSSVIDAGGTAHVTRVVPVPTTISPEAQKRLARPMSDADPHQSLADRRSHTDIWQAQAGEGYRQAYNATVAGETIAGVPVKRITPPSVPAGNRGLVMINLHGGGFNSDSGSLTESIPVAGIAQVPVVAVLYRLAPEHPFPAALDDAIAVYRDLLKTHKPSQIAIFGTSAGAILTAEVAVRIKQLGLPEPAALGIFSGMGDFSQNTDSQAIYALNGFSGHLDPPGAPPNNKEYVTTTDPKDPVLSPVYADLRGLPPTLFITSTRDALLSGTSILHRSFLHAGVDAQLIVFEGLPHAFWNDAGLPESKEAHTFMAEFLAKHLKP